MNSFMYRPNMWSQGWPKHVAVCCVYRLITVYLSKCVGSVILFNQLTQESRIIQITLLFYSKIKSSRPQQLDSKDISRSNRLTS